MQAAPNELDRLMGERVRHAQDYQTVLASRDDQIDRLRHSIGPGSERWKSLADKRNRASAEYEALAGQIGRPVNRLSVSVLLFCSLALGLAVIETPVNKFLFDVALQSSNVASTAVSFAVAVFLLVAAHFAGKLARQVWSEHERKLYISNIVVATLILTVLSSVLAILTIGRAEFSAAALSTGLEGLFASVGDKVAASGGFLRAIATALGDTSALVLVTVNVTSILAAFLLGYFAHDPDKHFDKAFEKHRSAQRAVERQDQLYKSKSNQVRERARLELDDINEKYTAANAAIVTQKTARRIPLDAEDRFALPDLDRLLERLRAQSSFGSQTVGDEEEQAQGAGEPDVASLIKAGSNVTRVSVRDSK
ncbi:MAG: hypothetical protein M5U16_15455 [Hyphomicrobium sp.]|nr:hypothetical protein [Hyphomicrobium sp.]